MPETEKGKWEIEDIGEYEEYGEWFTIGENIYILYDSPSHPQSIQGSDPGNKAERRALAEQIAEFLKSREKE